MANSQVRFHTIITHIRPHIDEIFAIWLLKKFGEFLFSGISTAKIVYKSTGVGLLEGKTAKMWAEEGVLLVGIGKGRLDEHSGSGTTEKKGDCCATLVAKALDVYSDLSLKDLIAFVFNDDTDTDPKKRHPFDLGRLVMVRHKNKEISEEKVVEMTLSDIDSFYTKTSEILSLDKESLDSFEEVIKGTRDKKYKLVTIDKCDNEQIGNFSRSVRGYKADITIARGTSGHVNISTSKKTGLKLHTVSGILNYLEQKVNGNGKSIDIDLPKLEKENAIKNGRWFYHKDLNMMFNGGSSAPDTEPSKIPLDDIKKAIRIAMNPEIFDGSKTEKCRKGTCVGPKCLWRNYNLSHCETVWRNERRLKK